MQVIKEKNKGNFGFSLIEMIIGMTIIALFFGTGIANYRRLNNRKQVEAAAKQVESAIRETQKNASAGVKPGTWCSGDELVSYSIQLGSPLAYNQYIITANCSAGSPLSNTYTLENNVRINSGVNIIFDLYGRTSADSAVCIRDKDNKFFYQITVTQGGAVSLAKTTGC